MLAIAALHIVDVVIGVPLIIVGILLTAWITDWMKRGKRWA